jgi:hypothetical protein
LDLKTPAYVSKKQSHTRILAASTAELVTRYAISARSIRFHKRFADEQKGLVVSIRSDLKLV